MINNIFSKVRQFKDYIVKDKKFAELVSKSIPNFDPNFFSTRRQLMAPTGSYLMDRPYEQSVWIYAANKTISQSVSQSPYKFYKKSDTVEREELPNEHEVNKLFDRPNPMMSRQELIFATMIYLGLDGEVFWILERNNPTALPSNIWCFRKSFFQPEIDDKTGLVKFWKFQGEPKIIFPENIIQFKYYNPEHHYEGLAPWKAAALSVEQDYFSSNYNTNFFKNGAAIGGFLETTESLDDDQYNRLISSMEDRHMGHTKSHRLMLLEGGVSFKEAKLSQRDMEFIETKKLTKTEILAAYGTNPVVLGDFNDVKSEAGVRAILKDFWTRVIIPNQDYIENKIYSEFLYTYDPSINVFFDNSSVEVLQDDLDTLLDRAKKLFEIGYSINIINKRLNLGMPKVSHGDFAYLSGINLARIDEEGNLIDPLQVDQITQADVVAAEETPTDKPDPEATQEEEEEKESAEDSEEKKIIKKLLKQIVSMKVFDKDQKEAEDEWKKIITLFFISQEEEVLNNLNKLTMENIVGLNDPDSAANLLMSALKSNEEELSYVMYPLWNDNFKTGYDKAAIEIDFQFKFSPLDPNFLKFQEFKVTNIPNSIFNTVKNGIRDAVRDSIANGESINELAERISKVYDFARKRAITIARTESTSALNAGKLAVYSSPLSKVSKIKWVTAGDERVRGLKPSDKANHVVLDGQEVVPGQFFKRFGLPTRLRFPGDMLAPPQDVINCRCTIVPTY